MRFSTPLRGVIVCLLFLASQAAAAGSGTATNSVNPQAGLGHEWHKWFTAGSTLQRLANSPYPVFAVASTEGLTNGWVFRTDQVPPVVNGKRGQIGVVVGLGKDGLIKGVHVVEYHEDPTWFNRIKPAFYAQFNSKPACRPDGKIDTVTGATISSHAIIEDVFLSSQTVMSLPEVNPLLKLMPAKQDK